MHVTINKPMQCVMARIVRQRQRYQKNFLISEYRTWERATAAARKWVKAQLAELPDRVERVGQKTARNTSGVVGVRLADATRRKDDKIYPDWRWVAFWTGCPKSGGLGWSVNKYGDAQAFVSAYLARALELVDRDAVDAEVKRLKGSPEYRAILRQKKLSPP
jgi:hypothetical protein